jgi:exopolyphosphatase/guanosine-5'-triphosphate,3'-diphosphate pyrophosphatase
VESKDVVLAGLDIGTNTFRLLIARVTPLGHLEELHSEQQIIRLGEGLEKSGHLQPQAINRALDTLKHFRAVIKRYPVDKVVAVATSAVREAVNGNTFVKSIEKETGIQVEIVSPEEEARRTLLGVLSGFHEAPQSFLVMDIGGGSTEFVWGDAQRKPEMISTDLGVVRLTERYLSSSRTIDQTRNGLMEFIQGRLEKVKTVLAAASPGKSRPVKFIGTAGTITTLAAVDLGLRVYDPQRIHLHRLSCDKVRQIVEELASKTSAERLSVPGVEKGREDLIVPGGFILLLTMQTLDLAEVVVSEYGLREGILVDYCRRLKGNFYP